MLHQTGSRSRMCCSCDCLSFKKDYAKYYFSHDFLCIGAKQAIANFGRKELVAAFF